MHQWTLNVADGDEVLRLYVKADSGDIWITKNCWWDEPAGWYYDDDTNRAYYLEIGNWLDFRWWPSVAEGGSEPWTAWNQTGKIAGIAEIQNINGFDQNMHRLEGSNFRIRFFSTSGGTEPTINPVYDHPTVRNSLYGKNVPKVFVEARPNGGSPPHIRDGFNAASMVYPFGNTFFLQLNFVVPFKSTEYSISGMVKHDTKFITLHCVDKQTTDCTVLGIEHTVASGHANVDWSSEPISTRIDLTIMGPQDRS
jgi:hypothetical protein